MEYGLIMINLLSKFLKVIAILIIYFSSITIVLVDGIDIVRTRNHIQNNRLSACIVRNLIGEPGYKNVHIKWESDATVAAEEEETTGYKVRYCELQAWGPQRCRTKHIAQPYAIYKDEDNTYNNICLFSADITGLRMATTYSFEVMGSEEEQTRENSNRFLYRHPNMIIVPTKGFSAKATLCLPNLSEIEVSTGPFFGGRIAVEAADGERCILDGDANNPLAVYTLRIEHSECGSFVNETTVATYILVQENLPILTHSTRRFLVLCTYQPETLTVRAGLSLPKAKIASASGRRSITSSALSSGDISSTRFRNKYSKTVMGHSKPIADDFNFSDGNK